jgi:threonylcarbamoyladenosine tRNA methylthiotransferase MtaB
VKKNGTVVVTGCFVNSHIDSLESDGRTFIVPNEKKNQVVELLEAHFKGEIHHPHTGDPFAFPPSQQIFHTRGMVKIQDGCDNFCTFCIIPFVRGRAVSRPPEAVLDNMKQLLEEGYKEIVLTGVNMSRYQHESTDFTALIEKMLNVEGDFRLRISSIEPDQISDRFLELLEHPKMCPHLHLCLQSGSEKTLLAMRRQYSYRLYKQIVNTIRDRNPLFNITTDIIIGFPGEDDSAFEESLNAAKELVFGHIHAFPYSVRKGTRAERMDNHQNTKTKNARGKILRDLSQELKRSYRSKLLGQNDSILVESIELVDENYHIKGLGSYYVPIELKLPANRPQQDFYNRFIDVKITGLQTGEDPNLEGEILWSSF